MKTGQESDKVGMGTGVWGSWCLEATGPDSSSSLRGTREANPADVVTVDYSSL